MTERMIRHKNPAKGRTIRRTISMNADEEAEIANRAQRHHMTVAEYMREVSLLPQDFVRKQADRSFGEAREEPEKIGGRILVRRLSDLFKEIGSSLSDERVSFAEDGETVRFESEKFVLIFKRKA